jgi:hypothetical protein
MKTNLVHTLHCIKGIGSQPIESFKNLLSKDEYQKCLNNPRKSKTWYKMTAEVFENFLFWI